MLGRHCWRCDYRSLGVVWGATHSRRVVCQARHTGIAGTQKIALCIFTLVVVAGECDGQEEDIGCFCEAEVLARLKFVS